MNRQRFSMGILFCVLIMTGWVVPGCSKSDDATTSSAAATYTISGAVTGSNVEGVTITLSGAGSNTTATSSAGAYSFTGLSAGNYTIIPTLTGYSFSPSSANVTISTANVTVTTFTEIDAENAQTDLEGTWNYTAMKVSSSGAGTWEYGTANIDSIGNLTGFSNCNDSNNTETCPAAANTIKWTIDASNGVITEGGTEGNSMAHMTLASNKAFIAGSFNTDSGKYQLMIAMKKASSYSASVLYGKSFVEHQLEVGSNSQWRHGAGNVDSSGAITISSEIRSVGTGSNTVTVSSSDGPGTISVDSSTGAVTFSNDADFHGFLSSDGKTIVGVETKDTDVARMLIIQITGQTYTAGNVPDSTLYAHLLRGQASSSYNSGWARWTEVISSGSDTQNDYVDSFGNSWSGYSMTTPTIDSAGVVTKDDSSTTYNYHGQMSYDKSFVVGTATYVYSGTALGYDLIIHTVKN